MYYGNEPHKPSSDDRTVIACRCGWFSPEMTKDALLELGVPWYCDDCGAIVTRFATFHPRERAEAYEFLLIPQKGETPQQMRERLLQVLVDRWWLAA